MKRRTRWMNNKLKTKCNYNTNIHRDARNNEREKEKINKEKEIN